MNFHLKQIYHSAVNDRNHNFAIVSVAIIFLVMLMLISFVNPGMLEASSASLLASSNKMVIAPNSDFFAYADGGHLVFENSQTDFKRPLVTIDADDTFYFESDNQLHIDRDTDRYRYLVQEDRLEKLK